ncbi:MAG: ATP-dependent DNA ligase [Acidobacteria bacterium]|nr:ATP-dependent DNA ligase [Acidobacteriota bacterium]
MKRFAQLFAELDGTNATNAKVEAIARYFVSAPAADAAWALFFLLGRRLKRLVPSRAIGQWALAATDLPEWMLGESYQIVGDGAETATLLLDQLPAGANVAEVSLAEWVEHRIMPLRTASADVQQARVLGWVRDLDRWERFTLLKLITGELRLGASHTLVVRAVSQVADVPAATMAARLMGDWTPSAEWFAQVTSSGATDADRSRPYPFFLASPVDDGVVTAEQIADTLGDRNDWLAEWKWDGIRAQIVQRDGRVSIWSRGEELITTRFPEIAAVASALPDGTVIDGEIVAFRDGRPLPFSALQQRIARERDVARATRNVPVVFMAFDLLETGGEDCRSDALATRRERLAAIVMRAQASGARLRPTPDAPQAQLLPLDDEAPRQDEALLQVSALVDAESWPALAAVRRESRVLGVEGLMLKRRDSPYGVGRKRGDWWKWKIEPHTIDAVLIYAQPGSGKRASLLTDYTFGLWHEGALVPVAKAYSGLNNDEIAELDRWIRTHTVERFGPVRHVEPVQVMELGFEAVARSSRHRSGVAVRFPRMLRWRKDKPAAEADTLDALMTLIR